MNPQSSPEPNPQLLDYIYQHVQQGNTEFEIRQILQQYGWDTAMVDQAFAVINGMVLAPAAATSNATLRAQPSAEITDQNWKQSVISELANGPGGEATDELYEADATQKYRVFQSLGDWKQAIANNKKAYFTITITGTVISIIIWFVFLYFTAGLVLTSLFAIGFGLKPTAGLIATLIGIYLAGLTLYCLTSGYLAVISIQTLNDGRMRRQSSVGAVLKSGIRVLPRLFGATLLFTAAILGPYILILLVSTLIAIAVPTFNSAGANILSILVSLASIALIIVAMLRYSLSPMVAIFEPELPLFKILPRSRHLLVKGGQWFLFKGFLLLVAASILIAIVSAIANSSAVSSNNANIGLYITIIVAQLTVNVAVLGSLTMLYFNRRAVRGNTGL